ncbi:MAG TPA: MFS transporter [Streptosporangiaceae bacterium]
MASLAGSLAQSPEWLTAARAVQGVGGAVLSPASLTLIITAGLGALAYAIIETISYGWLSARILTALAVAVILLAAFAVIEQRLATAPLVPFGLFGLRSVAGANLAMLPVGAAFFSVWYFLSLYFQDVLGYSALRAGLAFIPMALAVIAGAQASPRLLPRAGRRALLAAGMLLAAGGFAWLAQMPAHGSYLAHVLVPGCIVALAIGLLFTPLASVATTGVPMSQAGLASGVLNTSRQIGGSVGLAALATVAVERTRTALAAGHGPAGALTAGYDRAFVVAAVLSLAGLGCSFLIPGAVTAAPSAPERQPQASGQPERR